MVKEIIIVPVMALLVIGFVVELESIAKDSAQKSLDYADDMNSAMDCATRGIPISVCAPDLMDTDFTPEVKRTRHTVESFYENLSLVNETVILNVTDL